MKAPFSTPSDTMTTQSRIKNAKGQWLSNIPNTQLGKGTAWLSASLLASFKEAAALPGAAPEIAKLLDVASKVALRPGPPFMDPHTPESEAAWAQWCVPERAEAERYYANRSYGRTTREKELYVQGRLDKGKVKFQPTTEMTWIYAPAPYTLCWTEDPGKASLLNGSEAYDLKAHCEALVALSKLLPKALKSALALGVAIDPRAMPTGKLLPGVALVANAEALPFSPESEYLSRSCFALYIEHANKKGFVTHKDWVVKPDLGSARLFPTQAEADTFGRRYRDFALVKVDIAPQSFERRGSAGDMRDLAAAISAKEALELDLAIKNADIDRLRDEIKARELLAPPPPPAPARSSRL